LEHTGLEVVRITRETVGDWVLPDEPLHPAFEFLSSVHRADYLRAYVMHHHGGGYTDVKMIRVRWVECLERLERSELYGAGYREIGRSGVANTGGLQYRFLQLNYRRLIGNCAFVFRPRTPFTTEWMAELTRRLDKIQHDLQRYPAKHAKDKLGLEFNGKPSRYPVSAGDLMGKVFHPLVYKYRRRLSQCLPPPDFTGYDDYA